jgi:hypothetical protein
MYSALLIAHPNHLKIIFYELICGGCQTLPEKLGIKMEMK